MDYKTDDVAGCLEALVAFHTPQLTAYAHFWGRITGEPVRAGIFLVRTGEVRWLDAAG